MNKTYKHDIVILLMLFLKAIRNILFFRIR